MLLTIREDDSRAIYLQIMSQIKEQVSNGALQPGEELPSVREVADSLGINMHTVRSAYLKLRDQGIINMHLGRRATIARRLPQMKREKVEAEIKGRLKELVTDALLSGIRAENLHRMLDEQLEQVNKETT